MTNSQTKAMHKVVGRLTIIMSEPKQEIWEGGGGERERVAFAQGVMDLKST